MWVANQTAGGAGRAGRALRRRGVRPAGAQGPRRRAADRSAPCTCIWSAGRFRQSDFDFIIAVANLVVIALVRARAHTSLESDFQQLVRSSPGYDELIGESKPMLALKAKIERVSRAPGLRADPRRERLGQGAGRPRDPPRQPPRRPADDLGQLRRDPRRPDGEPALRPQGGRRSPAPTATTPATSSRPTWARCFSTKSAS